MRYSPQLDGLRAIAILAVLVQHLFESHFRGAWVGVDIFFVLSGFLITSILISEHEATGTVSLKNFYGRRALRLLPALVLCIALTGLLTVLGMQSFKSPSEFGHAAIPTLFYFANFTNHETMGTLVHTWSLSVEEQFYLIWPLILIGIVVKMRPAARIVFITCLITVFAVVRFYFESQNQSWWNLYRWFHTRADELMFGALIACATSMWPEKIPSIARMTQLLTPVALAFIACVFCIADAQQRWLYQWGLSAIAIACAVIVFTTQFDADNVLSRILKTKPVVWIGKRSYGIYVYHVPIIWAVSHHVPFPAGKLGIIIGIVAKVGTTLIVSWASYRWIEAPALALKDKWFTTKRSTVPLRAAPVTVT